MLIKFNLNTSMKRPKFIRDPRYDLVDRETGEIRPHTTVDTTPTESFFRVYIGVLGELFSVRSLAARNLLLWMMKNAQRETNRVYLHKDAQEEAQKDIGVKQAQFYASLRLLESQGLIYKVRNGIWEIDPNVMFNGTEESRKLLQNQGHWKARVTIEAIEVSEEDYQKKRQEENLDIIDQLQEAYNNAGA